MPFTFLGLAPYYRWREVCNLSPINSWTDLENATRPSSFRVLKEIYQYDITRVHTFLRIEINLLIN